MGHAPNVEARHEHSGGRDLFCISAYNPAHPWVVHELKTRIEALRRDASAGDRLPVDVNSNVCFAVDTLKALAPDLKLFHLARDGRKVVASNWLRKMYTAYAKGINVCPTTPNELGAWEGFDRFQKLSWQWNHIVSGLLARDVPVIRLEDALSDYDYLEERLLAPAGIDLPRKVWDARRGERVNGSKFRFSCVLRGRPLKLDWTAEREAQFQELCGASMGELGYI